MSGEWITDRRPTAEDAVANRVWTMNEDGTIDIYMWSCVGDRPWMPIKAPEPYVEQKRVRRAFTSPDSRGDMINAIETFDDDPADWDVLLDAVSEYCDQTSESYIPQETKSLFYKMCKALEPKK